MRKRTSKKWIVITVIIVAVIGLGVGVFFGARAIYNAGVNDGRQNEAEEVTAEVQALGQVVSEKAEFKEKVAETFTDLPETINSEWIDKYIEKLNKIIEQTTNEDVKTLLNDYLKKWQEFKETYAGKDNDAIAKSFDGLKVAAKDTASKIEAQYNEAIKAAIQNL